VSQRQRRQAARRGRYAELLCLWLLRLKGYRILAHGYRVPVGEIDILAKRGRLLVAVEVKARGDWQSAAEALGSRQRRRIGRALQHFSATRPDLAGCDMRFDVMLVRSGRLPRHLVAAWQSEI
jgi:putative endonuclease